MENNKAATQIGDLKNERIDSLRRIFPSVFKDGTVDFEALKEELGEFVVEETEKYDLNCSGKKNAKKFHKNHYNAIKLIYRSAI